MPEATTKLPGHLRNRCLAPTAVKLHFSAVPKPVRMPKAPESADPDAPKRKRGGQPGNTNRLKHGRYSAFAMPPEPAEAKSGYLLDEQRIDFGPRRRGAQPGNMNRMRHGQRSVRSSAGLARIKALIARGKAILDICNTLAAMCERFVAQRDAAAADAAARAAETCSELSTIDLPPFTGEVPRAAGGRGRDRSTPVQPHLFPLSQTDTAHSTPLLWQSVAGEDQHTQPPEYLTRAVPIPVRIPRLPENRTFRRHARRYLNHPLRPRPAAQPRHVTRHRAASPPFTRPRDAPTHQALTRPAHSHTLNRRRQAA
jgi:hypothetical protein